jgi:hypothetical protein
MIHTVALLSKHATKPRQSLRNRFLIGANLRRGPSIVATFKKIDVDRWTELHQALDEMTRYREEIEDETKRPFSVPLFRGLGNHAWRL